MIPSIALNREIQLKIGDQLRVLHDDIISDGVPDQFVELLARLEIGHTLREKIRPPRS